MPLLQTRKPIKFEITALALKLYKMSQFYNNIEFNNLTELCLLQSKTYHVINYTCRHYTMSQFSFIL